MSDVKSLLDWISKKIDSNEILSLVIAVAVATVVFAYDYVSPIDTIGALPLSFLAVVTALLLHELAHRFVAKKLRCHAVYKIWLPGIVFALLLMLIGIKLIIIGAVFIATYRFGRWGMKSRHPSEREIGFIASAGPVINLAFAAVFELLAGFTFTGIFGYLAWINLWIAISNLIPVRPLDGSKIFFWNTTVWLILIILSVFMMLSPDVLGTILQMF